MEREILFKAKRIYDNEWIIGNLVIDNLGNKSIVLFDIIERDGHHIRIDSDEPMFYYQDSFCQFTGMNDKYGNKIFEHDNINTEDGICEVIFDNGGFIYELENGCFCPSYNWHNECIEVIGNKCICKN